MNKTLSSEKFVYWFNRAGLPKHLFGYLTWLIYLVYNIAVLINTIANKDNIRHWVWFIGSFLITTLMLILVIRWKKNNYVISKVSNSFSSKNSENSLNKETTNSSDNAKVSESVKIADTKNPETATDAKMKATSVTPDVMVSDSSKKMVDDSDKFKSNLVGDDYETAKDASISDDSMDMSAKAGSSKGMSANGKDDLKIVEGIGPRIEELLNAEGIKLFSQLADTPVEILKGILTKGGPRFTMHEPTTWPNQAALARDGKWKELSDLQDSLTAGR